MLIQTRGSEQGDEIKVGRALVLNSPPARKKNTLRSSRDSAPFRQPADPRPPCLPPLSAASVSVAAAAQTTQYGLVNII